MDKQIEELICEDRYILLRYVDFYIEDFGLCPKTFIKLYAQKIIKKHFVYLMSNPPHCNFRIVGFYKNGKEKFNFGINDFQEAKDVFLNKVVI